MPMPPSRARAIARRASVTVSMAAETTGIASSIVRVRRVRVETSFGRTRDSAGTRSTSSNVRPSLANFRSRATSRCSSSWRSSVLKGCPGYQPAQTIPAPNKLLTATGYGRRMRVLLAAAVSLVAAVVSAAGGAPRTQTLYSRASGMISAFAQDDGIIAWFTPSARRCNAVHVKQLDNPLKADLPKQGDSHNVTCRWNVGHTRVSLVIAGDKPNLLWTLHEYTPLEFDYLVGAGVRNRRERRFQQLAHTARGAGLWLGGIAGDGSALVYGGTSVDYEDEAGCLAGTDTCALKIVRQGGSVYRVIDGQKLKLIPETTAALAVATSGSRVAYVEADSIEKNGRPVAGADLPIEVVNAVTGHVLASITPQGT